MNTPSIPKCTICRWHLGLASLMALLSAVSYAGYRHIILIGAFAYFIGLIAFLFCFHHKE